MSSMAICATPILLTAFSGNLHVSAQDGVRHSNGIVFVVENCSSIIASYDKNWSCKINKTNTIWGVFSSWTYLPPLLNRSCRFFLMLLYTNVKIPVGLLLKSLIFSKSILDTFCMKGNCFSQNRFFSTIQMIVGSETLLFLGLSLSRTKALFFSYSYKNVEDKNVFFYTYISSNRSFALMQFFFHF